MTRSAPKAVDWNSNMTALLVIASTLGFGCFMDYVAKVEAMRHVGGLYTPERSSGRPR
jgi:hypothetical protein